MASASPSIHPPPFLSPAALLDVDAARYLPLRVRSIRPSTPPRLFFRFCSRVGRAHLCCTTFGTYLYPRGVPIQQGCLRSTATGRLRASYSCLLSSSGLFGRSIAPQVRATVPGFAHAGPRGRGRQSDRVRRALLRPRAVRSRILSALPDMPSRSRAAV